MSQGIFSWNSLTRLKSYHFEKKVLSEVIHIGAHFLQVFYWVAFPLWKWYFEFRQVPYIVPGLLRWSPHGFKDLEYLAYFRVSIEQGSLVSHFVKNAPHTPNVNCRRIYLLTEQNFRSPIPQSNYFMGIGFEGEVEGSG